jgi:hypothetical protein
VGLRGLAACAAAFGTLGTDGPAPAGLDTYRRLAADTLTPRLPLDAPTVPPAALDAATVDTCALTAI